MKLEYQFAVHATFLSGTISLRLAFSRLMGTTFGVSRRIGPPK
jgi:hypothetical protein